MVLGTSHVFTSLGRLYNYSLHLVVNKRLDDSKLFDVIRSFTSRENLIIQQELTSNVKSTNLKESYYPGTKCNPQLEQKEMNVSQLDK